MKPLDGRHHRAAAVLGQGGTQAGAAEAAGVSVRRIQELEKRDDFAALVAQARDRESDQEPGALATLRELLGPTGPDGEPRSEEVRLRAALGLVRAGRGGRDPADDDKADAAAQVLLLDPGFFAEEPEPEPVDVAAMYERFGGRDPSQAEADWWATSGATFGDGWDKR